MQLAGVEGATSEENGNIINESAKGSSKIMETEPSGTGGDAGRRANEEAVGEVEQPSKSNGVDADADKDEEKVDGDGGAEDTTGIFPAARVKRIMRKNPDKKKNFAKDTVHVVALATELFLQDMSKHCYTYTTDRKRRTMMLNDVGDCIKSVPRYEFLDGPGILPEPSEKAKKAKTAVPTEKAAAPAAAGQLDAAAAQDKPAQAASASSEPPKSADAGAEPASQPETAGAADAIPQPPNGLPPKNDSGAAPGTQ